MPNKTKREKKIEKIVLIKAQTQWEFEQDPQFLIGSSYNILARKINEIIDLIK